MVSQSGDLPSPLNQPDSPLSGFGSGGAIPGLSGGVAAGAAAVDEDDAGGGGGAAEDDDDGARTPPGEPAGAADAVEERPTKKIRI